VQFAVHREFWKMRTPFRITGHTFEHCEAVVAEVGDGPHIGRGEGLGVFYCDDMPGDMEQSLMQLRPEVEAGLTRARLQALLPPGGARNALDCALWDLEAKRSARPVWELTGVAPRPLQTVFTIGIEETAAAMAGKAAAAADYSLLKVKLDSQQPLERISAIRAARPDARIVVDANQGWTFEQLIQLAPKFADLEIEMLEQPLPRGEDQALRDYQAPLPLCADESCLHLGELEQAAQRYQMINIKLDKTGGLTHALELATAARGLGLNLMVGCMAGTSLSMAPAFLVGCLCDLVDIDGPLLIRNDRLGGLLYDKGTVQPFDSTIWG